MQLSHSESVSMLPKLCPCCCAGAVKIAASLLRQSFLASLLAGRASASAQPQSQTGQKPNRPPTLVQCSELLTTFWLHNHQRQIRHRTSPLCSQATSASQARPCANAVNSLLSTCNKPEQEPYQHSSTVVTVCQLAFA